MYLTLIVAIVTSNYIFRCSKVSILIENIYISNQDKIHIVKEPLLCTFWADKFIINKKLPIRRYSLTYLEFRHNPEQQTWLVRKPLLWWCSTVTRVSGGMLGVARLLEIAWTTSLRARTLYMGRTRGSRKKPADPIKNIVRLGSVYNAVSSMYNSEAPNSFYIESNKQQGPSLPEVTLNLWLTIGGRQGEENQDHCLLSKTTDNILAWTRSRSRTRSKDTNNVQVMRAGH